MQKNEMIKQIVDDINKDGQERVESNTRQKVLDILDNEAEIARLVERNTTIKKALKELEMPTESSLEL